MRSRRYVLAVLAATLVSTPLTVGPASSDPAPSGPSLRPTYHLTGPPGWLSDPQRPVWAGGRYNLYYLFSDDPDTGQGDWHHATTTDGVVFADRGTGIPRGPNFPVWTGSGVVDTANTAGFGAGAVVVLATQPTGGDRYRQEQYLWYSTDDGDTFAPYGPPVIANPDPGHEDWFRDPKIEWDAARHEWVAVIGRNTYMSFYTSPDLKTWTHESDVSYTAQDIGGMECPDLFRIRADDGTVHWVLAASVQGDRVGLPDTYAYWTGSWDGHAFHRDHLDPQFLDHGFDWYAGVTWPDRTAPLDRRFAIAWMNNWRYASLTHTPTYASDGISGQMSLVRELTMARQDDGGYALLSEPVRALQDHVTRRVRPPDVTVDGTHDLGYHGTAYELDVDVAWSDLDNVGLSVGVSADGSRHTDLGVFDNRVFYLNRQPSEQPGQDPNIGFYPYVQSESPFDPGRRSVHLRVFVDRESVEVFVGDGRTVHSDQVFFASGDTGIRLYSQGGPARFSHLTVKELDDVTTTAAPTGR